MKVDEVVANALTNAAELHARAIEEEEELLRQSSGFLYLLGIYKETMAQYALIPLEVTEQLITDRVAEVATDMMGRLPTL